MLLPTNFSSSPPVLNTKESTDPNSPGRVAAIFFPRLANPAPTFFTALPVPFNMLIITPTALAMPTANASGTPYFKRARLIFSLVVRPSSRSRLSFCPCSSVTLSCRVSNSLSAAACSSSVRAESFRISLCSPICLSKSSMALVALAKLLLLGAYFP